MAYLDNINANSTDYAINSFANLLLASGGVTDAKTVTFPNGYDVTDGSNMTFRVLFPYGHNGQANMTLNGVDVVVNKYGTLIPLPYHNISSTYKSLQANTVLEMYYTSNYDGNNTPAFVIVGNPIVLSSNNYIIYADGKNLTDTIYPVGSLYWSSKSTDPSTLFGGTWVQIKDRFVLACGDIYKTVGATGGASSVTLSVSNMPSHSHSFTPSGTITMNAHYHGLNNHTHNFSGTTGSMNGNSSGSFNARRSDVLGASATVDCSGIVTRGDLFTAYKSSSGEFSRGGVNYSININHNHSFSGTTNGNSGDTTPTTSTGSFSGTQGTTSPEGSGTSFSILPPYVVKYCFERTA